MKAMDEKCLALHVELAKEKKLREEAEERQAKEIQDEINRLCERIDQERRGREGEEDAIIKKLNDELIKLQDILQQEQKIREESENSLIKVLEDMCSKMQNEQRSIEHMIYTCTSAYSPVCAWCNPGEQHQFF